MIEYSSRAAAQVVPLLGHCEREGRPEAMRNLLAAIRAAREAIQRDPSVGIRAPRPYPWLERPGRVWLKSGSYGIAYRCRPTLSIAAGFYDRANIPGRL